jgi:hypothetical protein
MLGLLWFHIITLQTIVLNSTQPCVMNQTAGANLWSNCGMATDWLSVVMEPWQWVTGGWFTMILVSVIILMIYIKYQKMMYTLLVGLFFIPMSYYFFPPSFTNFAIIMVFLGVGLLVGWIIVSQTNET